MTLAQEYDRLTKTDWIAALRFAQKYAVTETHYTKPISHWICESVIFADCSVYGKSLGLDPETSIYITDYAS